MTDTFDFNGLPAIRLQGPKSSEATVLLHGAHLVSWKPDGRSERIFLSEKSAFEIGQAVRGGIPVCFPQFSDRGPLPAHGFARLMNWQLMEVTQDKDHATATLRLADSAATQKLWPHAFAAELIVSLTENRLDVELEVSNPGDTPFTFTTALHTYLRVDEVEDAQLEGLRGQRYWSKVTGQSQVDTGTAVIVDQEIDRVYFETANALMLKEYGRALGIHSENMPETIVWNPWEQRCKDMADMPDSGFRRMLCVEAGAVETPIELAPQAHWWGRQTLVVLA